MTNEPTAAASSPAWRNDLAVWPGLFAVSMGLMAVLPTLPLYIEQRFGIEDVGAVQRWSGLIFACGPLAAAFSGPFWGAMAERIGRKPMVLRAMLVVAVAMAVMPFAPSPGWLAFLRVLQGLGAGYVAPAMALGTENVPPEKQARVMARLQVALSLGLLTGPEIGAQLLEFAPDRRSLFWFSSAMAFLATVPILVFAREGRRPVAVAAGGVRRSLGGDVRGMLRSRTFVRLLFCVALLRFGQNMTEPQLALWVRELGPLPVFLDSLPLDATAQQVEAATTRAVERTTARAFSALALMALLLAPQWARLANRFGPLRSLAALSAGLGVLRLAIAGMPWIEAYSVLRVIECGFMAGSMTLAYSAVARRVRPEQRALAFGWIQSGMQLGFSTGPIVGGILAEGIGLSSVFVVTGVCLLSAAGYMLYVRRDDLPVTTASGAASSTDTDAVEATASDRCAH